jgi:outer membrane protein assembly factor BamE (lipoprotein component of BamABCDE complex)
MKTALKILALLGGLAVLAGCSTPETRIRKNPEAFNRLAPAQQEMIRQGKVGIGFDQDMVKLALGEPDRVVERTDARGTSEIWHYVTYEGHDGVILYSGYYHRYWGGTFYPYYLSNPGYHMHERIKVIFQGGKVVVVEQRK